MENNIISKLSYKISDTYQINLISYEGEGAPHRILSNENEFIILDNNNYGVCHGVYNESKGLKITYIDPNLEMTINNGIITIENSKSE